MVRRTLAVLLLVAWLPMLGNKCGGGNGSGGDPPTRRVREVKDCAAIAGSFPPGFAWMPGSAGRVVAVEDAGPGVLFFDMNGKRPKLVEKDRLRAIPPDSDGDGVADEVQRLCSDDASSKIAVMGKPLGVTEELAFVATSGFDQVMFVESPDGRLTRFNVTNPPNTPNGSYHGEDYPYLPADADNRTAITTKACVYLTDDTGLPDETSSGRSVGQHACCDREDDAPSFMTAFTAGMAIASDHLFVAMSNLDLVHQSEGSYFPGTVMVYDVVADPTRGEIHPNTETPILFTTGFNPTGVAHYQTRAGRDLILVTNSGASGGGTGQANILSDSYIDVIDVESLRLVATIPMGRAALGFDAVALDPGKRVGLIGSWAVPHLYAIDLRALEDDALFDEEEVIWLDGSDPGFPDARIFDADAPFEIPDRAKGPHPILCDGWTFAAINGAGEVAYVLERCDGSLTRVDLLEPNISCAAAGHDATCCDRTPLPASCFSLGQIEYPTEPFTSVTGKHGPSQISVRPGEPGVDYTGPDVFFTVDLPDPLLCGMRVDSF